MSVEHRASTPGLPGISTKCHQLSKCKWLEGTCFSWGAI